MYNGKYEKKWIHKHLKDENSIYRLLSYVSNEENRIRHVKHVSYSNSNPYVQHLCYDFYMNAEFWNTLAHHAKNGPHIALVSIIAHKGSTPQSSGNKMIVFPSGSIQGTIGGGSLEHQVTKLALHAMEKKQNIR